jgi:hypothetical protein
MNRLFQKTDKDRCGQSVKNGLGLYSIDKPYEPQLNSASLGVDPQDQI